MSAADERTPEAERPGAAQAPEAAERAGAGIADLAVPVLPLNHVVGLPGENITFTLQNEALVETVKRAHRQERQVFAYCPAFSPKGSPAFGTLARVSDLMNEGNLSQVRFRLQFEERAELVDPGPDARGLGLVRVVRRAGNLDPAEARAVVAEIEFHLQQIAPYLGGHQVLDDAGLADPDAVILRAARYLKMAPSDRAELLAGWSVKRRLELFLKKLAEQEQVCRLRKQLRDRTGQRMQQLEKEAFLHEERRLIDQELGRGKPSVPPEFQELADKVKAFAGPPAAREVLDKELGRLCRAGGHSPQAALIQDYLEVLLELPWTAEATPERDWARVEASLEASHFGLKKVKRRVLEQLAVRHLSPGSRGPLFCFLGPPGVGKTSVARAMAAALGLPFVKKSLGGVHDECEIRGHRRTYIGSLPGRVIQGLRKAGCKNPLFLLDEVDKMGRDHRGSPADALLEVLDPEENHRFSDHYLELEFDLSKVFWVLTANSEADIPEPLRDRLEIIRFSGYTEAEKIHIARGHLLPRLLERLALPTPGLVLGEDLCRHVIRQYTREAGVRELERKLAELVQNRALECARGGRRRWNISRRVARQALGVPLHRRARWPAASWKPGVMAGLAWTPAGGDVLRLECSVLRGKGAVRLTGKMGEVMQESAHIACSYVRRHAEALGIDPAVFETSDLHVHIPAGAVSKEGPSAGLGLALLVYGALARKAGRPLWAVTGELALHGVVLPVGGIKEKILAAQQEKFAGVVLPADNRPDVEDIDPRDLGDLEIRYVSSFAEARKFLVP